MSVYSDAVNALTPISYYRLNELTGSTVAVDAQSNYPGVYEGVTTFEQPGLVINDLDTSIRFGDSPNRLYVATAPDLTGDFSISFLMNTHTISIYQNIIRHVINYAIYLNNGRFDFYGAGSNLVGPTLSINTTYHVVLVRESGVGKVYIDGITDGSTATYTHTLSHTECFGNSSGGQSYLGHADEFAIFDKALTQAEITNLYEISLDIKRAFDIVIDHTKVPEDLYDFPMLVNLSASSGIDSFDSSAIFDKLNPVTSNDGFDSLFTGAFITLSGANNDIATCTLAGWESTFTSQTIVAGEIKYFEYEILTVGLSADIMFGVAFDTFNLTNYFASGTNDGLYITNATTFLWPTGTILTLPSGLSIGDVIGIKFQYDGMLITFYKNGTEYETIDLITVSSAVQATSPGKVALSLNKLNASVQLKLQASEFSYSTPTGATPWGQTGDTDLTPITAIYINPADNTFDYSDLVKGLTPIGYYRLGEDSGVTAFDEIANHNGTYYGTPTLGVGGGLTGDIDTAVNMLSPDYMVAPFPAGDMSTIIESDAISLSVMFKGNAPVGDTQMCCISNGQSQGFCIGSAVSAPYSPGIIHKSTAHGNQWLNYYNADTLNIYDGVWHHLVATFDGTNYKLYVDGTLLFDLTGLVVGIFVPNVVGVNAGVSYYNEAIGDYDELIAFDKVLTQSDVTALRSKMLGGEVLPSDTTVYSRQCKVEVDRWDQANEQAQLHIKIPYISKDVDTIVNLSYDPTNADNSANVGFTGTLPAQQVWTEYDAVYHLSADGADSTINALDGTLVNIDDTNIVDFGIGKGLSFNATNEAITLGDNFDVRDTDVVFSAIIEVNAVGIGNQHFFSKSLLASLIGRWWIGVSGDKIYVNLESSNTIIRTLTSITTIAPNTEYIIDVMWDRDGVLSLYINGTIDNTANWSAYSADYDITCPALIGAYNNDPCTNIYYGSAFAGTLKEFRFDKVLKPVGWLSTNYNSSQDTLVRYSNADSYILARSIFGSITESVAVVDWLIRAYRLDTGVLTAQLNAIAGAYQIPIPNGHWVPTSVVCTPEQGVLWTPLTAQLVDDLIYPNDPETTPYYFKCTVSGTGIDGVTASVEPTWPTTPGQTVVDGTVTWEVVERMIQPIVHSPMIPK